MERPVTGELRELPNNSLPWGTPLHPLALLKSPLPQGHVSICHCEIFGLCAVDSTCRFLATYYMKLPLELQRLGVAREYVRLSQTQCPALFSPKSLQAHACSQNPDDILWNCIFILFDADYPTQCLLLFFFFFQNHYMTNTLQWDKIMLWWPKPDNSYASITLCSSSHQSSFI